METRFRYTFKAILSLFLNIVMKNLHQQAQIAQNGTLLQTQNISLPLLILFKDNLQMKLNTQINLNSYLHSLIHTHHQNPSVLQVKREQEQEKVEETEARLEQKGQNETKNIPKNFGKAIITFIQRNERLVKKVLEEEKVSYEEYVKSLKSRKKGLNSIANLREIWLQEDYAYAKVTRTLSIMFLKRGCLKYIFNSRIENYKGHIKYRNRLMQVLRNPKDFTSIKVFSQ